VNAKLGGMVWIVSAINLANKNGKQVPDIDVGMGWL
jgi:hypothetical protein